MNAELILLIVAAFCAGFSVIGHILVSRHYAKKSQKKVEP